jgi:hypothetical protein
LASAPPVAPPNVPHARLMNLISALSTGLGAAAHSMATGGKEGGAAEVVQIQGEQQRQKQAAVASAVAQKNAAVQTQLTAGETARANAQNYILLATMHDQVDASHFKAQEAQQGLAKGGLELQEKAQDMFDTKGQVPAGWTVDANTGQVSQSGQGQPSGTPSGQNTPATGATPSTTPSVYDQRAGMVFDNAEKTLMDPKTGTVDPIVAGARQIFANPASTIFQKQNALSSVQRKAGMNAETVKTLTAQADLAAKQNTADPLYKLESDPSSMEGAKASAAIPMLQNRLLTETDPQQKIRVTRLLSQAQSSHNAFLADKKSEETSRVLATAGDPKENGQALAEGDVTLADLKSRGSTPKGIVDSVNAAKAYAKAHGKTYNASDEVVGEQALKGQTNQNFYGSARSLVQQGGMLDQLKISHDNLGNAKIPGFNQISDWMAFNAGTPELAAYKQAVLAAADDYAKVMGGGSPNLEQFNSLRDRFAYQLNNRQLNAAVDVARNSVRSQVEGRIGPNNYIRKREGDILQDQSPAVPTGITGKAPGPDGNWYYHDAKGNNLGRAQ